MIVGDGQRLYGGVNLPSVSEIVGGVRSRKHNEASVARANEVGLEGMRWDAYLDYYGGRGNELHEFIRKQMKREMSPSVELSGQWSRWWEKMKLDPIHCEVPMKCDDYVGTPDMVAMHKGKCVVIDWKTGMKRQWHRMQVVAYSHLVEMGELVNDEPRGHSWMPVDECWVVYVKQSGVEAHVIDGDTLGVMKAEWETVLKGWQAADRMYKTRLKWLK